MKTDSRCRRRPRWGRIHSIETAALTVGFAAASAAFFVGAVAALSGRLAWGWAVVATVAVWGACTITAQIVIKRYIIFKLKPIYQVVLSRGVKTSELRARLAYRRDVLSDIGDQLGDWAEGRRREIARLKENEQYRKEFLGNVSHEIKTPIFNVQGYISTLLDGGLEDPSINRRYLERAEKSIDRLIHIVDDLDVISDLESGRLDLRRERFDLVALTREIIEANRLEADRKAIRLGIRTPGGAPVSPVWVMADEHYVGQVLINLISNSIHYGKRGGYAYVSFVDLFDKVMVEVTDNGIGIAQEDIPRLFERFYRADKSRSREQGGTGLGLAIVKHILEAHSETIAVRSRPGEGTTFSFTLSKA